VLSKSGLADDRKWRKDIAESMLRAKLLNGPEVDTHLCKVLQISRSPTQPVEFAVHIVRPNCSSSGTLSAAVKNAICLLKDCYSGK
jgi:hypothetical protein